MTLPTEGAARQQSCRDVYIAALSLPLTAKLSMRRNNLPALSTRRRPVALVVTGHGRQRRVACASSPQRDLG